MIDTAVILAAGMGTRLQGEVTDRPKGFLELGGQPIIAESIQALADAGIGDVVIVTGHCAGHYDDLASASNGLARTVHNPAFAESGSMYSLYCARDAVQGSFLLLESDLIYEPRALTELLSHPADDAILLSGPTGAGDEVYVSVRDGNLVDMSKDAAALGQPGGQVGGQFGDQTGDTQTDIAGELVGISKISAPLFEIMLRIARQAFERTRFYDYETDCLVAAGRERNIACPVVPDLVWAEIDDPAHLDRARKSIYPEIQKKRVK